MSHLHVSPHWHFPSPGQSEQIQGQQFPLQSLEHLYSGPHLQSSVVREKVIIIRYLIQLFYLKYTLREGVTKTVSTDQRRIETLIRKLLLTAFGTGGFGALTFVTTATR